MTAKRSLADCQIVSLPGVIIRLIVDRDSLPDCLEISAESPDGLIMAVRHKTLKIEGMQFHPESILTEHGKKLLQNFMNL